MQWNHSELEYKSPTHLVPLAIMFTQNIVVMPFLTCPSKTQNGSCSGSVGMLENHAYAIPILSTFFSIPIFYSSPFIINLVSLQE